jgi:hypothetical protein
VNELTAFNAIGYDLTSAVPEPGTLGMFGFGISAFGIIAYLLRRNRRFGA